MATISVIVPVFNVEKFIEKCIQSILSQTFRDIDIFLINDGSLDNSGLICEEYSKKDKRIKYFSISNHGVGFARNLGMKHATGEWLCFVDGDDYLPSDALENLILSSRDADIVIGDYFMENNGKIIPRKTVIGGRSKGKPQLYRLIGYTLECHDCLGAKNIYNVASPWGKIYRSSFCLKNNLSFPDLKRSQDVIFNINAYQLTKRISFIKLESLKF